MATKIVLGVAVSVVACVLLTALHQWLDSIATQWFLNRLENPRRDKDA